MRTELYTVVSSPPDCCVWKNGVYRSSSLYASSLISKSYEMKGGDKLESSMDDSGLLCLRIVLWTEAARRIYH
ncbi:hypothetical protein AOLI_G00323100 [Acnodon oligacanthus]